jgi:hypothetical protein
MWPAPAPTSRARCGGWAPTAPTYLYCQTPWMRLTAITAGAATATSDRERMPSLAKLRVLSQWLPCAT